MNFPENLKYTKDHEWVHIEGEIGIIGISDYAQSELGDVVYIELPSAGRNLKQGETFGTIEAVKAVSDLYSPIAGEITEVNAHLEKTPELVNKEPYDGGWMIKIKFKDRNELKSLLDVKAYRQIIGK